MGGPAHRRSQQRRQADRAARGRTEAEHIDHTREVTDPPRHPARNEQEGARGGCLPGRRESGGDGAAAMIGEEEEREEEDGKEKGFGRAYL